MSRDPSPQERRRLLEEELHRLVEILRREVDPERIILFGSLATGEIGPWSDIDLELISKPGCPIVVYFVSGQPAWEGKADGISGVDG